MKKSTALALSAALLTLASCGVNKMSTQSPTGDRLIDVGVGRGFWSDQRRIEVGDEVAGIRPTNNRVVWLLQSSASGYRFGVGGIKFDYPPTAQRPEGCTSTPDPKEAFVLDQCKPEAGGLLFVCPRRERQQPGACFKYTVTLDPLPGSDPVPPKDPWIKNE